MKVKFLPVLILCTISCASHKPSVEIAPACYRQESHFGKLEWVAAKNTAGENYSKDDCYAADSCEGGLGARGGDCYKWSKGTDEKRIPWNKMFTKPKVDHWGYFDWWN